jgi:hypothetical protein
MRPERAAEDEVRQAIRAQWVADIEKVEAVMPETGWSFSILLLFPSYSTRWLIEEFHKALKTGTKAEELQLETAESLFAAIAIKSIAALPSVPIPLETLSSNSLMSRAKEAFNVSRLVIIIEAQESITYQG